MPEPRFFCQSGRCYICTYFSDPAYEKSILNRCVFNFWQLHLFLLHFPSYFFIVVLTDCSRWGAFDCVFTHCSLTSLFPFPLLYSPCFKAFSFISFSHFFFHLPSSFFFLCNSWRPKEHRFGCIGIKLIEVLVIPSLGWDRICPLRWQAPGGQVKVDLTIVLKAKCTSELHEELAKFLFLRILRNN